MLTVLLDRYSAAPYAGQRRAVAVNLVVFFLFALTAVILLTRTAVAANSINRDVASTIEPATDGINADIKRLPVLDRTVRITHRIAGAAEPVSTHLEGVVQATGHINRNLASTREQVITIGTSVEGIERSTRSVGPAVVVLNRHVDSIHGHAGDIVGDFRSVAGLTSSMAGDLTDTNASLARILAATEPLRRAVHGIDGSVVRIDGSAGRIENSPILLRNLGNLLGLGTLLGDLTGGN